MTAAWLVPTGALLASIPPLALSTRRVRAEAALAAASVRRAVVELGALAGEIPRVDSLIQRMESRRGWTRLGRRAGGR